MRIFFTLALVLWAVSMKASHIVGGEFRMRHISGFQYRFDLIIYFDVVHGNPGSKDFSITAKVFRNSDNSLTRDVTMPLISETDLNYSQISCSLGELQTKKLVYSAEVTLQPDIFNDPAGYYIAWERCCRNYTLTNIQSNEPTLGTAAGQTFLLEFPAVMPAGEFLSNSSPEFFPPLADYACVGNSYFADFSAQDADGDSLVYSIVAPLSTHTFDALPAIGPKPYPLVTWRTGFTPENMLGGSSHLSVNSNGLITVSPTINGLFAYAVKCDEYRNGVKLGSVRREYQVLSLTCPVQTAPKIQAKTMDGTYSSTPLTAHIDYNASDANRCIQVQVTDADASTTPQQIRIRAIPIGFSGNMSGILPDVTTATLSTSSTAAEFQICFDRCSPINNNSFQVAIVGYDASCAVALTDTVYVNVIVDNIPEGKCQLQHITFPAISDKTYGTPPFSLEATASSGLALSYSSSNDWIASIAASEVTLHQPGRVQVTALQSGDASYQAADPVKQSFCINPVAPELTVVTQIDNLVIRSNYDEGNLWYRNGEFQSVLDGPSIPIGGENEDFTISARVMINQCISEESNSIVITGLEKNLMHVFPNPVSGEFTVTLGNAFDEASVELIDAHGRLFYSNSAQFGSFQVSLNGLPPGVYLLRVRVGASTRVQRILKK